MTTTMTKTSPTKKSKSMSVRSLHVKSFPFLVVSMVVLAALSLIPVTQAENAQLNQRNYYDETYNKTVFIKFFTPWCSFSKKLAPDWDKLAKEWKGHDVGLVAEVDCSNEQKGGGKSLCNHLKIESFPTLKYGDPTDLWDYDGGRSFEELNEFAKENLVPRCSIENFELCDDVTKLQLKNYVAMDKSELKKLVEKEKKKLEDAEKEFKKSTDALTLQYEIAEKTRRKAIDEVMHGPLGMMRQVQLTREDDLKEEEENSKKNDKDSSNEEL